MNNVVESDGYKLPAGILALAVHAVFFALLYFGFSWQTQPPVAMSVELWQSLPEPESAPPVKVITETPPPARVEEVFKPDIVIPDKKLKPKPEVVKPPEKKPEVKPEIKPVAKPEVKKPTDAKKVSDQPAKPTAAEQQAARDKAEQESAIGKVVGEYSDKIRTKIKRNVVMPPDVANDARAEFLVTVLPGGRVLPPRLIKSSGNAAYDSAVERAILKSEPLPMPEDTSLFNRFRELKLGFKPVE